MLATARAHLAAGEGARPRALAHELLAVAPAGTARAEALLLLSELEGAQRATALLEEALDDAAGNAALEALLHWRLGLLGRLTKGMAWAQRHAGVAVDLAEGLDDDALRAGALSTLALLRFNGGDPDAPREAERAYELAVASGDGQQVQRAEFMLAHVLSWSVLTERARDLLESHHQRWRDEDERSAATAHWFLALVELRAGRWLRAEQHAESAYMINVQYGNLPRFTCSRSDSSSPIAATSGAPGSWPTSPASSRTGKALTSAGWRRSRASSSIGVETPVRLRSGSPRARWRPMQPAGVSRTFAGGAPTTQRR